MKRAAVPVKDQQNTIFIRTGRAPYFAIFKLDQNGYEFERRVENPHAKKHHHDKHTHKGEASDSHRIRNHVRSLQVIENCDYLLAIAVGPYMKQALKQLNVEHVKFKKSDGQKAEDFVRLYLNENHNSTKSRKNA